MQTKTKDIVQIIPSIQTSHILTPRANTKEKKKNANLRTPRRKVQSTMDIAKVDRTFSLKEYIKKIKELLRDLTNKNKSEIFVSLNIIQQFDSIEKFITPLCNEMQKTSELINSITNPDEYRRVSLSTLKQMAFTFTQKWKEFTAMLEIINNEGIKSNADYIQIKFYKVESIITDITINHKRTCSKTSELEKAGGVMLSLIGKQKNSIQMLVTDRDLMKKEPKMQDNAIDDLKQFLHLYNERSFELFQYSGYMPCELGQYKSNFQTSINEIICGIKCGFSFDDDMKKITDACDDFNALFTQEINEIKLPNVVIREVERAKVPEVVAREVKQTVSSQLDEFVGEYNKNDDDIVLCSKLDVFIDNISRELGTTIEANNNVWKRLDSLSTELINKVNNVNSLECEIFNLTERLKNQKNTMQDIIFEKEKSLASAENKIIELNNFIEEKNAQIEAQNDTIHKNVQQITHQRQIIYELRSKLDKKYQNDFIDDLGNKMEKMMTELDFNNYMIPNEEDLGKKGKFDVFIMEKRCSRCNEYEKMSTEVKKKIREMMEIPKNAPLPRVIDTLIENYRDLETRYNSTCNENCCLKESKIILRDACTSIINQIYDKINENKADCNNMNDSELAKELENAFEKLKAHHCEEIIEMEKKVIASQDEKLLKLLQAFRGIVPDDESDKNMRVIDLLLKKFEIMDQRFRGTEMKNYVNEKILNSVEKWMNKKTGFITDGLPHEHSIAMMMKAIDEAPNPLQEVVDKLSSQIKISRAEIEACYKQLSNERALDREINEKECDFTELVSCVHMLVEQVSDEEHAREFVISQLRQEIDHIVNVLRKRVQDIADVLCHEEINTKDMELHSLIQNLELLIEEIIVPGGNKHFVSIIEVNKITFEGRQFIEQQLTPDPTQYLPIIMSKFIMQFKTLHAIKKLQYSLNLIFRKYDFSYDSFDPYLASFNDMKNDIFSLYQTMYDAFNNNEIEENAKFVIRHILALVSIFLSACVALKMDRFGEKGSEEYNKSLEEIKRGLKSN